MQEQENLQLGLYLSAPYECSYLPEKIARSQVIVQSEWINTSVYSALIEQGFRRSGTATYRPRCDQCQACVSVRLCVDEFQPSRTQQRMFKKHAKELTLEIIEQPVFEAEHFELYDRYQKLRHAEKAQDSTPETYDDFLVRSYVDTHFLCFRDVLGTLRMVSVFDRVHNGLSAVYTFYDPEYKGSLGTFAVMCLADLCLQWQLPYLYLGYWVKGSEKMDYKTRYQPLEFYVKEQWSRQEPLSFE